MLQLMQLRRSNCVVAPRRGSAAAWRRSTTSTLSISRARAPKKTRLGRALPRGGGGTYVLHCSWCSAHKDPWWRWQTTRAELHRSSVAACPRTPLVSTLGLTSINVRVIRVSRHLPRCTRHTGSGRCTFASGCRCRRRSCSVEKPSSRRRFILSLSKGHEKQSWDCALHNSNDFWQEILLFALRAVKEAIKALLTSI